MTMLSSGEAHKVPHVIPWNGADEFLGNEPLAEFLSIGKAHSALHALGNLHIQVEGAFWHVCIEAKFAQGLHQCLEATAVFCADSRGDVCLVAKRLDGCLLDCKELP